MVAGVQSSGVSLPAPKMYVAGRPDRTKTRRLLPAGMYAASPGRGTRPELTRARVQDVDPQLSSGDDDDGLVVRLVQILHVPGGDSPGPDDQVLGVDQRALQVRRGLVREPPQNSGSLRWCSFDVAWRSAAAVGQRRSHRSSWYRTCVRSAWVRA